MNIQPIKLLNIQIYNNILNNNAVNNVSHSYSTPAIYDKFEISFNGLFENSTEPVRLDQAKNISGIHCPACGVIMLPTKEYENILYKAERIRNPQEFLNLLKENKKSIPKHMQRIIEDGQQIDSLENMTMMEFHTAMKKTSYKAKQEIVHKIRDDLNEYTKWLNLPENENQNANDIVSKIHTRQEYSVYKNIINEYIQFLNLHSEKANQIKMKTLKPVVLANDYYRAMHIIKEEEKNEDKIALAIARNIFYKSLSSINPMDRYPQHEGLPNNQVLICENCKATQSKNTFIHDTANSINKKYIDSYLADIAYLIGHNKMEDSKDYITAFCLNLPRITRGKINFSQEEIKSLKHLQYSASRHEIFAPIQQSKYDIPCAECGSPMLTHEMRKHVEAEMHGCKTIQDYAGLLKKYSKYTGVYAKPYVKIFISTAKDNPNASTEKFLQIYKKKTDSLTDRRLRKSLLEYEQHRDYYLYNGTPEQLKNYDLFNYYVKKYIQTKSYLDNELITYYNMCIRPLDLEHAPVKAIYAFNTEIKKVIFAHRITTSENAISKKSEDPIYTLVFNIFKMNVATADHLQATSKGGENSIDNLIGLCKTCNRIKSKKDVKTWIIDNKRIKTNIAKQMEIVDQMAKSGDIQDFDNWAENISEKLYKLSEGKIDLRQQYKKET